MSKNIIYVPSIKSEDKDQLKTILNSCGIVASDESVKNLYRYLCYNCGTEFTYDMILNPITRQMYE